MASSPAISVNVANFVSAKLWHDKKSNNYNSWREQMLCLIESQGMLDFIKGKESPLPPEEDTDDYAVWRRTDRLVKGWILGALSDEVVHTVVTFDTASDVWSELEKKFGPPHWLEQGGNDLREYLSLYKAALRGDWDTAKRILDQDPDAAKARISRQSETALHIAVGTRKAIHFVAKLVDMMPDDESLAVKDKAGHNALHIAAVIGNTAAARILVARLPSLLYEPSKGGYLPVSLAAYSAHRDILDFLIYATKDDLDPNPYDGESGLSLLCRAIDADFFDIALRLVDKYPHLATIKHRHRVSALQSIAQKESAFSSGEQFNFWERLTYSSVQLAPNSRDLEDPTCSTPLCCEVQWWHRVVQNLHSTFCQVIKQLVPQVKKIHDKKLKHQQALKLVKSICKHMELSSSTEANASVITSPLLMAAHLGIHEVVEVIVETFPDAIYYRDMASHYSIIHIAVENRCEKVFNLIYHMTDHRKNHLLVLVDASGDTIVHLAARLAPPHKLNQVSGAALQMQRELQWFKEVEKIVPPYMRERGNTDMATARMVFTEEHKNLKVEGEKWMKDTANSCTIAAALIATVVFAAAITVPGGNKSDSGYPMFSTSIAFIIFAISDAISLFTSTTSLLMFLSILTSRYAEEDFLYALPKRLCIGLVTLFVSISFMIAAFSATIYLVFGRKHAWVLIPVAALACLPITSFVLLQFPLLVDVISSTYGRGIFGKQSDRPFY